MYVIDSFQDQKELKPRYLDFLKQKNMPHAFMFVGPAGTLKEHHAFAFAKQILIKNDPNPYAEKKFDLGQHPDFRLIEIEQKASSHSIVDIKKAMEEITLNPFESKVRVIVIKDADKMLPPAANALLKTLEEPVSSTVFILLGSSESSFLKTVASRCVKVLFALFSRDDLTQHLINIKDLPLETASIIAKYSFGSLDAAMALLNKERPFPKESLLEIFKDMDLFSYHMFLAKLELFEKLHLKSDDLTNDDVFEVFLKWIRDVYCVKSCKSDDYLYFVEEKESLNRQSKSINMDFEEVMEIMLSIKRANKCNVKLKSCLEALYLELYKNSA